MQVNGLLLSNMDVVCLMQFCGCIWKVWIFFETNEKERCLKLWDFSLVQLVAGVHSINRLLRGLQQTVKPPDQQKMLVTALSIFVEYKFSWILCSADQQNWMFIEVQYRLAYCIDRIIGHKFIYIFEAMNFSKSMIIGAHKC